jgi:hypothetical protein
MKKNFALALATFAIVGVTSTSAFAGPHCPPGEDNVWGACIKRGSGIFNPIVDGRRDGQASQLTSAPHCKPPLINVWGACVQRPQW